MKTKQHHFFNNAWKDYPSDINADKCQLVLVFGSSECIVKKEIFEYIKNAYPKAEIVLASTAGEIINDSVYDNSAVVTAVEFKKSTVKCVKTNIREHTNSFDTGNYLIKQLDQDDLCGVLIISDGTSINGSELVDGFNHDNYRQGPLNRGMAGGGATAGKNTN